MKRFLLGTALSGAFASVGLIIMDAYGIPFWHRAAVLFSIMIASDIYSHFIPRETFINLFKNNKGRAS